MSERLTGQLTSDGHELLTMPGVRIAGVRVPRAEHETDIATAKRLAACWNACEGINDEELTDGVVSKLELREVLEELTKTTLQNDFNAGWNDALDAFFTQATGEQP